MTVSSAVLVPPAAGHSKETCDENFCANASRCSYPAIDQTGYVFLLSRFRPCRKPAQRRGIPARDGGIRFGTWNKVAACPPHDPAPLDKDQP